MYRRDPERRKADQWHKLLNNGYRFAAVYKNNTEAVYQAARFEYELSILLRFRRDLILIVIKDRI